MDGRASCWPRGLSSGACNVFHVDLHPVKGREQAKAGAEPEGLPVLIDAVRDSANLRLLGLMTMPPWSDNAEDSRPYFRRLRELAKLYELADLSMGMSHDLEVAIEEGATYLRVGTALFGKRKK